jgi:hypothetical protein
MMRVLRSNDQALETLIIPKIWDPSIEWSKELAKSFFNAYLSSGGPSTVSFSPEPTIRG